MRITKIKLILFLLLSGYAFSFGQRDFYWHQEWAKNAAVYEVNIRQYTPEGTFKAFAAHLPHLKELGVDILWIMPVNPIGKLDRKGSLGSYYAVSDYQKINPEFGTMADFKDLVKKAHNMGFKVILDWVANHSATDNYLVKDHPDWYMHDSTGKIIPPVADWTDVAGFNYDNKDLREYQIASMRFWIKAADVDGFRCDAAKMVPLDFWKEARRRLDTVKRMFMLAEAEGPEFHRNGFDMTYGWEFLDLENRIAKGEKHAVDIEAYVAKNDSLYKGSDYRMYFTSNHDENLRNGSEFERLKAGVKCFEVLCFTLPGMPMMYSGQEAGLQRRLRFFDKDTISWGISEMQNFYTSLIMAKKNYPELWMIENQGIMEILKNPNPDVFAFKRALGGKQVIVVLNLSDTIQKAEIKSTGLNGVYHDIFNWKAITLTDNISLELNPWEYLVIKQE